jgi:hypothetical protein
MLQAGHRLAGRVAGEPFPTSPVMPRHGWGGQPTVPMACQLREVHGASYTGGAAWRAMGVMTRRTPVWQTRSGAHPTHG